MVGKGRPRATRHKKRRLDVTRSLRKAGAPALLVTNAANVRWLTGFTGDSTYLLLIDKRSMLISDSRYTTQIAEECPDIRDVHLRDARSTMTATMIDLLQSMKQRSLGFESNSLSHAEWEAIDSGFPSLELMPTSGLVEEFRQIKDRDEIDEIRDAVRIAERSFSVIRHQLRPEQTEREIAHNLEHTMRSFGAVGAAFPPIVAVGPRAALPHARPGSPRVADHGLLLLDWGAETSSGYRSDLTRVLITGKISTKLRKLYEVVLTAQVAAIGQIRPGARCVDIDSVARNAIADAGYGDFFGHGLGHGIGLDIHELPRFSPIAEAVLKPGMVVTVEPGIYLPGIGGVRIEDDVLVTRDGCELLTNLPKELEEAVVAVS